MKHASVAHSWDQLAERFDKFVSMACLTGSGPEMDRCSKAAILRRRVSGQLNEARDRALLPDRPYGLAQAHVAQMLRSMRTAGRGPSHTALWNGLWRAIILNRDDYRCYFCGRSG